MFGGQRRIGERLTKACRSWGVFVIVGENYAVMVHRFAKFHRQLEPGLNFLIPMVDQINYVHDLREEVLEIHSQVAVTKDNVALNIDGVLYVKINDPYAASYGIEDYKNAVI